MKQMILALFFLLLSEPVFSGNSNFPEGDEGAKQLVNAFLDKTTDVHLLTKTLRPEAQDFEAYFVSSDAKSAKLVYDQPWDYEQIRVVAKEGETQTVLQKTTTDEIHQWQGNATHFPSHYQKIARKLKKGNTIYLFSFVEPGQKEGSTYDGLTFINGHWVFFPTPWRAVAP